MPTVTGLRAEPRAPAAARRDRARCSRSGDLGRVEPPRTRSPARGGRGRPVRGSSADGAFDRPGLPPADPAVDVEHARDRGMKLSTGAEVRITGDVAERAVVCVNGGQAREVPGTWSASIEWLVRALAPQSAAAGFRRGALPREVVAPARRVRRRRPRRDRRDRRGPRPPARLLHGRRRLDRVCRRAGRRGGRRASPRGSRTS